MRIPSAQDFQLGQRLPQQREFNPIIADTSAISRGLDSVANSMMNIADTELKKQKQAEQQQLEGIFTAYQSDLETERKNLLMNKELAPDQYLPMFEAKAAELKQKHFEGLNPEQQKIFDQANQKQLLEAKKSFDNIEIARYEHAQEVNKKTAQQYAITNYETLVSDATSIVMADSNIRPDEKYALISRDVEKNKEDLIKVLGPEHADLAELIHSNAVTKAQKAWVEKETERNLDEAKGNILSIVESLIDKAAQSPAARREAEQMLDMVDMSVISAVKRQEIKSATVETMQTNEILAIQATIEKAKPKEALEKLKQLRADLEARDDNGNPKNWQAVDPDKRAAKITGINNQILRIDHILKTEAKQAEMAFKQDLHNKIEFLSEALKDGQTVPQKFRDDVYAQARKAGGEYLLKLNNAETKYGWGYQQEQKAKNPFFGTGIRPITSEEAVNPELFAKRLSERLAIGAGLMKTEGLSYLPMLLPQETEAFGAMIKQSGPLLVAKLSEQMKNAAPAVNLRNSLTAIAGQLADKDAAAAAIVGAAATGDYSTAEKIFKGLKLMKDSGKMIKLPEDAKLRAAFTAYLGDAMSGSEQQFSPLYDAYKAVYTASAAERGKFDGLMDEKLAKQTLQQVVGNVAKVNGFKVVLPQDFTEDRFRNNVRNITPELISSMGGVKNMTDQQAAQFIKSYGRFVKISEGLYEVQSANKEFTMPERKINVGGEMMTMDFDPSYAGTFNENVAWLRLELNSGRPLRLRFGDN